MTNKINILPPVPNANVPVQPFGPYRFVFARYVLAGETLAGGHVVAATRDTWNGVKIILTDGSWIDVPAEAPIKIITDPRALAIQRHPAGKRRQRVTFQGDPRVIG